MTYAADRATEAAQRGDQAAAKRWLLIKGLVDQAPALTAEQSEQLRRLLQPAQ